MSGRVGRDGNTTRHDPTMSVKVTRQTTVKGIE